MTVATLDDPRLGGQRRVEAAQALLQIDPDSDRTRSLVLEGLGGLLLGDDQLLP